MTASGAGVGPGGWTAGWTRSQAPDSLRNARRHGRKSMCVRAIAGIAGALGFLSLATACTPKVQVEAPKEPIVINMNVKIEHEIRVKVDKDLDAMFEDEKLF